MIQRNRLHGADTFPAHPILVKALVREKDRVSGTVRNLTFNGRHKSDLISFQGNKFYETSLPSAFCDINQASTGFFFFFFFAYRLKSIFFNNICTVPHSMTSSF